jgi:hypothetical protein
MVLAMLHNQKQRDPFPWKSNEPRRNPEEVATFPLCVKRKIQLTRQWLTLAGLKMMKEELRKVIINARSIMEAGKEAQDLNFEEEVIHNSGYFRD